MIKKHFKKLFCFAIATVLAFGSITAFASELPTNVPAPESYRSNQRNAVITSEEAAEATANGLEIIDKVTDPYIIQQMVNNGQAERDENGNLPTCIITYYAPAAETPTLNEETALLRAAGITVTKTDYFDGRYFDDYDRYRVDGPATFETTYSKKGSTNWNTSMSGDVSVGGSVYGVADVKAAVSSKVGYSFGQESTKTQRYTVNIPDKQYWEIKVWVSYLVYEYTAKVGTTTLGTGKTWKPNGLVIEKTVYNN